MIDYFGDPKTSVVIGPQISDYGPGFRCSEYGMSGKVKYGSDSDPGNESSTVGSLNPFRNNLDDDDDGDDGDYGEKMERLMFQRGVR